MVNLCMNIDAFYFFAVMGYSEASGGGGGGGGGGSRWLLLYKSNG